MLCDNRALHQNTSFIPWLTLSGLQVIMAVWLCQNPQWIALDIPALVRLM